MKTVKLSAASLHSMFPDEYDARIGAGSPLAILPIGSVEQHGPHLLLGCDSYIALALADLTAQKSGGVLYPMLPYSWIGGLRPYAGTIDMRPYLTGEMMEEVCLQILRKDFGRLVIINCHGGGREMAFAVARSVTKKTKLPVTATFPYQIFSSWPEIREHYEESGLTSDAMEGNLLIASLRYLGLEELSDKVRADTLRAAEEFGTQPFVRIPESFTSVVKMGEVGHDYLDECRHVRPTFTIDAECALRVLGQMAEKIAWAAEGPG